MNSTLIGFIFLISLCICLGIFVIKLKRDLSFHKLQEKELDHYSTEVETVYQQMQGIRHDYRNHLQVMSAYLINKEINELEIYLLELTNELNQVDTIIRTGNTMLDAIVNTKLTRAKAKGVTLHAHALAPEKIALEKVDLAVLLGNLLNNALEATTRLEDKQTPVEIKQSDHFIRLYIAPIKGNLYISVTNTMSHHPKQNFLSLKAPNRVGYGLKRINQVVEKYDGILKRSWEDGVFATEITLPLSQDK